MLWDEHINSDNKDIEQSFIIDNFGYKQNDYKISV